MVRQSLGGRQGLRGPAGQRTLDGGLLPGPFCACPPETGHHLCALLDDHSRIIPHAAYYPRADTRAFHHSFKEAIRRRGLPRKLYTDQGGPFINDHTRVICANLNIRLLHAPPYHAWSKGRIERFFHTLQQDFEATLRLPGQAASRLEELNGRLADWIQRVYHPRHHEGIGMSPQERFQRGSTHLRLLDPHLNLDQLFYAQELRTVRKDGTVRLASQLHEVDLALRGLSAPPLRPLDLRRITSITAARALVWLAGDHHLNSRLPRAGDAA
ncbi:MAG: transposase [Verrucomicrobiales bacterium]|nr:transposase [Verrucomicrobiales bacterium]